MKKHFLIGALLLTATSAMADPIDLQKATVIASDYLTENTAEPMLVKRAERDMTKARHLPAKTAQAAPYYIFSRGAGQGFVIVSGDDCLPDVLGYTEEGDFIEDQMPPQLLSWLDSWAKRIEETQALGENVSRKSEARKANYTTGGIRKDAADRQDVPVLMTSRWHQNWPYNSWCPFIKGSDGKLTNNRAVTGCVATAGAQVLYYFRRDLPELLGATTPTYEWGDAPVTQSIAKNTPMKWGLMLDSYPGDLPDEYYDAIGAFHLAVGSYTWMSYGASSGAYIENLCPTFNDCFNVASKNIWAGHSTLKDLAYNDLIQKRPVVYAGYNSDNEGHAIVIDGYRARDDKYHFNFGWGGNGPEAGGNGWYIMEDEGVNNFGINPSITYDIHPKKLNIAAKIETPQGFYANHDNKIRVTLKNKSTFPLEGVYLFYGTNYEVPANLQKANSSEVVTVPNDGSEVEVILKAKPAKAAKHYLFVTDEKLNILVQEQLTAESAGNDLLFKDLVVLGCNETVRHNGRDYVVVNGDHASFVATVLNRSEMSYQEAPRIQIFGTEDDGETFTALGNKPAANVNIEGGATGDFWFSVASTSSLPLEDGKFYAAALANPLTLRSETTLTYEEGQKMVYFTMRASEGLKAALDETDDRILRFSGAWNAYEFESIVKKRANANALIYDLSDVTSIGRVPVLADKEYNLILVGPDVDVTGVNVISIDGETARADHLSLAVGHDFMMDKPIQANSVSLTFNNMPNVWQLVTVPCNMPLPDGVFAKRIDAYTSTGITNKTTNVTELEAGQTYLLMTSSERRHDLIAQNVTVCNAPATNVCDALIGTFVNTEINDLQIEESTGKYFYLDKDYFRPATAAFTTPAFGGYFYSTLNTRAFRSASNISMDNAYLSVGQTIAQAYAVYDKYADYVTDEAAKALTDKIASCEAIFTTRELDDAATQDMVKELRAMMEEFPRLLDGESLTSEFDVTFLIVNPSFERGTTASSKIGSTYGWIKSDGVGVKTNDELNYRAIGNDGSYFVYSAKGTPAHGPAISQTIENVPAGVYALTAMLGTEPDSTVTLFANDIEQEVEASLSGQFYLREGRIDKIIIHEGESLTIGVRDCPTWYKADDFHLYFVRNLTPDEEPTGISEVEKTKYKVDSTIYDLTGRRVGTHSQLQKGFYIVGGKKVLIQ
ncbi:MAG: C10 family peptidase [Bacteroidaceae bacterium]|nr:C10 family peptidase [Bacteroidaceae bacterium]